MDNAEQIRQWIIRNGLLSDAEADQWIGRWRAQASATSELVRWLVAEDADRYKRADDVARVIEQYIPPDDLDADAPPELNPDFAHWLRSAEGPTTGINMAVSSPEGVEFMHWLEGQYAAKA